MAGNTFEENTSLKSLIEIEKGLIGQSSGYSLLVHGNTFRDNAAMAEANVLTVR